MKEIDVKTARDLVRRYHYSGKVVPNSYLHLGVFDKQTNNLVGVLQYGTPMNAKKTPQKIVKDSDSSEMMELNRMAMTDEAPKLSESQAISLSFKYIKRFMPHIKWLLSFSDGKEGNVGTIYQATNWVYLGFRESNSFYELDGTIWHSVQIWHKFKEGKPDVTTMSELDNHFSNISQLVSRQHIYVMPLSENIEFLLEKHPYPKKETEPRIIRRTIIKKDGEMLPKKQIINYINHTKESA